MSDRSSGAGSPASGVHLRHGAVSGRRAPSRTTAVVLAGVAVLGLALLLAVGCAVQVEDLGPPPPPPGTAPEVGASGERAIARDLFDRLNDERAARGLDPLAWDDQLAHLARDWSQEMATSGRTSHRDIDRELIRERLDGFVGVGENIFSATRPVPAGYAHAGWMRSSGHRANMLAPRWDRVGIGVVCTDSGGVYATQNFGRTTERDGPAGGMDTPPEEPVARSQHDGPTC